MRVGEIEWTSPASGFWSPAAPGSSARICASGCSRDGHDVLCVDNYFTGRKDNIAHLLANPHFEADAPRRDLPALCRGRRDLQPRLPGLADPLPVRPGADDQDQRASAPSTCSGSPSGCGAKILQASTSEVYGDPTVHPQTEDYRGNVNPIGPRACYDEGKRCAETLFFDYHRQHRLRIKVARIFNTYGPRMHPNDGRVVSNFIVQALQRRGRSPLRRRQPDARLLLRRRPDRRLRAPDGDADDDVTGPINLGNPHEITVRAARRDGHRADRLTLRASCTGRCRQDDPLQRCPDIARARGMLDWEPTIAARRRGLQQHHRLFRHAADRARQSALTSFEPSLRGAHATKQSRMTARRGARWIATPPKRGSR